MTQRRGSSRMFSSRSDRSQRRYSGASEFLTHVQLDDVPGSRSSKTSGDEFRQHDGVVTILMNYRRRASPKHCDNMTEVEYGGGGHRTRLRNDLKDQLVCPRVPPAPVYKGARGEAGRPLWRAPGGGVLLLVGVGLPSFLLLLGGEKEGGEGEGNGGAAPPLLVQFGPEGEGARGPPWPPLSLSLH